MPVTDFSRSAMANGNIAPYCAVMGDTSKKFNVIQGTVGAAAEGAPCLGIALKGERLPPHLSDGFHAIAGEACGYWADGANDVPARLGGTVTAFQELKCGTGGKLIAATTAGDNIVAVTKQGGILDDLVAVDVRIGQKLA